VTRGRRACGWCWPGRGIGSSPAVTSSSRPDRRPRRDQPEVRAAICAGLGILGVRPAVRDRLDTDGPVSARDDPVPVVVIEPREDLELARETLAVLADRGPGAPNAGGV
jgi:hypothetical protein